MRQSLLTNEEIIQVIENWKIKNNKNLDYHQVTRIKRYLELRELRKVHKNYRDDHDVFYENAFDNEGKISNWRYLPKDHKFWQETISVSLGERKIRDYPSMPLTNEQPELLELYLKKVGL